MERFNTIMNELTRPCYALLDWLEVSALRRWVFGVSVTIGIAMIVIIDWMTT